MSAGRKEPDACECRFCDDHFTAAGIKNHERYCSENPNTGAHPDEYPELFESETAGDDPDADADPDQGASDQSGSLPPARTLPDEEKDTLEDSREEVAEKCPACGSSAVIDTDEAAENFREELGELPDELGRTLEATDRYCNECWRVSGGALEEPWHITEGRA